MNTVASFLPALSGKWKLDMIYALSEGARRWSSLREQLPQAAPNVLTRQLRELERDGLVSRQVLCAQPPLVVSYALTEQGKALCPMVCRLAAWQQTYGKEKGA